MKRIFVLFVMLCLILCACAPQQSAQSTTGSTTGTTSGNPEQNTTQDTTQDTTQGTTQESTTVETTEQTEPPVLYRHPLTGAPLEAPWSGQITAVVINNLWKAMPQCGISMADVFYEMEVEGGITRCLALYSNFSDVGVIGPVRSARTGFNSIAVSFDAPLVHAGGSNFALNANYDASNDKIANWEHVDAIRGSNAKYFYRDTDRYANGYGWEHVLFTKGELLQKALEDKKYNTPTDKSFGLQFSDLVDLNGKKAEEIVVTFKGKKTSTFLYNAATRTYKMQQYGKDNIDGNTGAAVTFKNVVVVYTKQWLHADGLHAFYNTIGSGEGYAAINGEIVPILWKRTGLRSSYTYTLGDGTPLELATGNTYVALVGTKYPISYK